VPFVTFNNAIFIHATIAGRDEIMQLDTGANLCTITDKLADELIASGEAHEVEASEYKLADGSVHMGRNVVVNSLALGAHRRHGVMMSVTPDSSMLLGLPVLNAVSGGKFTIDTTNSQLVLG
jgi:predicted aspartyl protease